MDTFFLKTSALLIFQCLDGCAYTYKYTINVKNSRTIYFNGLQKHVFIAVNVLAILDHLVIKLYIFFKKLLSTKNYDIAHKYWQDL